MAITHVNTQTATEAASASVSATKPTGTASGDLLIAVFTSNSQDCTPPAGWTEMFDEPVDVFRCQVFRKVAGGSEPSSYSFSVTDSAPLALSITALRGINTTTPIDINPVAESSTTHAEPYTTPALSGGTAGKLMYLRAARISSSTPVTFTASSVTELADFGIFSGGSVSYSAGLYIATSEYIASGAKSGLAITASATESHNVVATWAVRSSSVPGTMEASLPLPTASMAGSWAIPAVLDTDLPLPVVDSSGWAGEYEGILDVAVPISVAITASLEPTGTVGIEVPILADVTGETRHFSDNVMQIGREERWLILTQEGYRLGVRTGADLPMRIDLPELNVTFSGTTSPLSPTVFAEVQAFDATTTGTVETSVDLVEASGTAENPSHISHIDTPGVSTEAYGPTVVMTSIAVAGHASVSVQAFNRSVISAGTAEISVVANGATVATAPAVQAFAGTAIVRCSNHAQFAFAGHASVAVAAAAAEYGGDDLMRHSESIGNGTDTTYTVTHNFGSRDVIVGVYDNTTFEVVEPELTHATTNTVTVEFAVAPASNAYRVVVLYSS